MKSENIKNIIKGLELITQALKEEVCNTSENTTEVKTEQQAKKVAKEVEVEEELSKEESNSSTYTQEELEGIAYNDLKKLAVKLGVSPKGNKATIVQAILGANTVEDKKEAEKEEVVLTETEKEPEEKPAKGKKAPLKKKEVTEEEEDIVEEEEVETDSLEAELEECSIEELADILEEAGLSTKGKKQSLIARILQGVEDGKIELEDDTTEDISEEEEEEEFDTEGYLSENIDVDFDNITAPRKMAIIDLTNEIIESYNNEELTVKEMDKFLKVHTSPEDGYKAKLPEEEKLALYIKIQTNLVDDEGNQQEFEEPYVLGDENYCCGHQLQYDEEGEAYICEVCGAEYDAE